jgi:hypothetical protein
MGAYEERRVIGVSVMIIAKIIIILGIIWSFSMDKNKNTTNRERSLHENLVIAFIGAVILIIILKVVFL